MSLSRYEECVNRNMNIVVTDEEERVFILNVQNHWVVITNFCRSFSNPKHIENENEEEANESSQNPIVRSNDYFIYESFNEDKYATHAEVQKFFKFLYKDDATKFSINVNKMHVQTVQDGLNDCGLFALAYVYILLWNHEPASCLITQGSMRKIYNLFVKKSIDRLFFEYEHVESKDLQLQYKKFDINLMWIEI